MSIQRILLVDIELDRTTTEQGMEYQVAGNTHHPLGLMYLASSASQVFPNIEIKILKRSHYLEVAPKVPF